MDLLSSSFEGPDPEDRVDGRAKVTGTARFSAEYHFDNLVYGCLVNNTVARGSIASIHTKAAGLAPGVLAVITHLNAPKVPGYDAGAKEPGPAGLKVFHSDRIYFYHQP